MYQSTIEYFDGDHRKYWAQIINQHKYKLGVEVGVHSGYLSEYLLDNTALKKYYMIDPWTTNLLNHNGRETYNITIGRTERFWPRAITIKDYSVTTAKIFGEKSIDWCYIDALHNYNDVLDDLKSWWPKIRDGGMLCGDDYADYMDQVVSAVNDFANNLFATQLGVVNVSSKNVNPQWYITKIPRLSNEN